MRLPQASNESEASSGPAARPQSAFADLRGNRPASRAVTVTDIGGLVVGFSVAGYVFRGTILAIHDAGAVALSLMAAIVFVWLGVVVAGPIVMALRRVQHGRRSKLTAGEGMWVLLGMLWLVVGVARRLRPVDMVTMTNVAGITAAFAASVAPILFVLHWRFERKRPSAAGPLGWCHHAGVFCAAAWPAGWTLAAFLLGV
jgi:hypothetical protein